MNYSPEGLLVWDTWYALREDTVHMFHLQMRRPRAGSWFPDMQAASLGHAISRDLLSWETLPEILPPDLGNQEDDLQRYTGCAYNHGGKLHLYFTMRGRGDEGRVQQIGLATSDDWLKFSEHPSNPVLRPNGPMYGDVRSPLPGFLECRDMHVIAAPGRGWLGFFATRVPGNQLVETSAIGCAVSHDLMNWEMKPPAFVASGYACVEVPDVFFLDGKWYMMLLTGNLYGNRGIWKDPNLSHGTIYVVAERPEGPYHEIGDNALVASGEGAPIAARSLKFQDELFVMYTDRERYSPVDHEGMFLGTVSTPKLLRTSGDRLLACYCPRIETKIDREIFQSGKSPIDTNVSAWGQIWPRQFGTWRNGPDIQGEHLAAYTIQKIAEANESFIFEAKITIDAISAGFVIRMEGHQNGSVVALDSERREIFYAETPSFQMIEKRQASIVRGASYHFRIVQRIEHVEIYFDDVLQLAFPRYSRVKGAFGLFVDRGKANFSHIRICSLDVRNPRN